MIKQFQIVLVLSCRLAVPKFAVADNVASLRGYTALDEGSKVPVQKIWQRDTAKGRSSWATAPALSSAKFHPLSGFAVVTA